MAKIKSKNTGIERLLANGLKCRGIKGYKRDWKVVGKPDIVFPKERIAVFCDGDFWHGYRFASWKHKLNYFWLNKISANIKRDAEVKRALEAEGWTVVRFWEHKIERNPDGCLDKIVGLVVSK